jgi:putative membrane protein
MKTGRVIFCTFAAVLASLLVTVRQSSAVAADEKSIAEKVAAADNNFMVAAAESGILEVRLGEIAKKKGATQEVKDFGAMMVTDHGKAGQELQRVAAKHDVTLPTVLNVEDKATVTRLSNLSGAAFDKAYIYEMVKAHTRDVSAFEVALKNSKDSDVKAFAQQTLPMIKMHLEKATSMAERRSEKKK